jgi:hypothetical protein
MQSDNQKKGADTKTGYDTRSNRHDDESRIPMLQKNVRLLLEYSISKSNIDIKKDFMDVMIPLIRKSPETISDEEEINLWQGYNQLSKLVFPATIESLLIASEIRHSEDIRGKADEKHGRSSAAERCRRQLQWIIRILVILVLAFAFFQGYTLLLANSVTTVDGIKDDWAELQNNIHTARRASPQIQSGDQPLKELLEDEARIEAIGRSATRVQLDLLRPLCFLCATLNEIEQSIEKTNQVAYNQLITVNSYARTMLSILSTHVLPVVLGLIGATSFITRRCLQDISFNSYTPGWPQRFPMRICLGGLLGAISGIAFSPSEQDIRELEISGIFVAFLMGYSVELAFSTFDRAIDQILMTIRPEVKSSAELPKKADGSYHEEADIKSIPAQPAEAKA